MTGILLFFAIMAVIVILDIAALRWGVDSREWSSDSRRSAYPVSIE